MKKIVLSAAVMFIMIASQAQTKTSATPSHVKAVEELMLVIDMKKQIADGVNAMVEQQSESNPMLATKKDVFKAFMNKYISWDAIKEDWIKIYTDEFSEAEIKDLTAFYRTPSGKKFAAKQTIIMQKGAELGQKKVQEHLSELQQMMK